MDPYLTERQLCAITGESVSTVQKKRVVGNGIPFVRIGRLVRYRQSDVDAYLAALPSFRSTSEPVGGAVGNYPGCPDDARNLLGMGAEPGKAA